MWNSVEGEWKILPAISVNKGCCGHQAITLQQLWQWALRELRTETECLPSNHRLRSHPLTVTLRRLRMRKKNKILAPDGWCTYQRNDFSELRLLHLFIHRRVLNSLTWDPWFSLLNSNFLMFWVPGLCCKNSYISWLPTLPLQGRLSEL